MAMSEQEFPKLRKGEFSYTIRHFNPFHIGGVEPDLFSAQNAYLDGRILMSFIDFAKSASNLHEAKLQGKTDKKKEITLHHALETAVMVGVELDEAGQGCDMLGCNLKAVGILHGKIEDKPYINPEIKRMICKGIGEKLLEKRDPINAKVYLNIGKSDKLPECQNLLEDK